MGLVQYELRCTFCPPSAGSFIRNCGSHAAGACVQVMNAALAGRDVYVLMPTGGGKSRCYQLPALVGGGVSVVVTPLVSLLTDQMQHLAEARIPAACFSAGQTMDDQNATYQDLRSEDPSIRVLFVTPEKVCPQQTHADCCSRRGLHTRCRLLQ